MRLPQAIAYTYMYYSATFPLILHVQYMHMYIETCQHYDSQCCACTNRCGGSYMLMESSDSQNDTMNLLF